MYRPEKQQNQITENSLDANLETAQFLGAKLSSWVACLDSLKACPTGVPSDPATEDYAVVVMRDSETERERVGLCASCCHMRLIRSDRESTFYMCQRSASDKSFPKYPRLPVIQCKGYEEKESQP